MTDRHDGGTDFPNLANDPAMRREKDVMGMTLRDWFAGQALAGILSNPNIENAFFEVDAGLAYDADDAMIAARSEAKP